MYFQSQSKEEFTALQEMESLPGEWQGSWGKDEAAQSCGLRE